MDTVNGHGMDPAPFIIYAYGLGTVGLFGYAGWVMRQRLRLRSLLASVSAPRVKRARTNS